MLYNAEFNGDVRAVWPAGWNTVERRSATAGGVPMTWQEIQTLAATCQQIIDGRFTGYDNSGQAILQLQAIDSSSWVVWSRDAATLDRVRASFTVEDCEEESRAPRAGTRRA